MTNVAIMIENENARIWEEMNKPTMDEKAVDKILEYLENAKRRLSDAQDELIAIAEIAEGTSLEDRINSIYDGVNEMWNAAYTLREKIRKGAV